MAISKQKKGTWAVSITNFLDAGCIIASGLVMTAWSLAFSFDNAMIGFLGAIGANAFGSAVGALIGGVLADKYGRKFIYSYNMLFYAFGAFMCMIALNLPMLIIGIVCTGLAVGIGVPASWTYISEESGKDSRANNIGISQFAWSMAPVLIFCAWLAVSLLIPATYKVGDTEILYPAGTYGPFDGLLGPRLIYLGLFILAMVAWWLQRQLDESKDWVEKKKSGKQVPLYKMMGEVLRNRVSLKTVIYLVAVLATWNIVAGTAGQFMPVLYKTAHFTDTMISAMTIIVCPASLLSIFVFVKWGDKIPHKILFSIGCVFAVAAWSFMIWFGFLLKNGMEDGAGWMIWGYAIMWGFHGGISAQCFYALWSTELFPTRFRGGAQGIMFFLVRATLGVWSIVALGPLNAASSQGFMTAAIIMTGFLIFSSIVGIIWCPKTQGKSLDQITKERYGDII